MGVAFEHRPFGKPVGNRMLIGQYHNTQEISSCVTTTWVNTPPCRLSSSTNAVRISLPQHRKGALLFADHLAISQQPPHQDCHSMHGQFSSHPCSLLEQHVPPSWFNCRPNTAHNNYRVLLFTHVTCPLVHCYGVVCPVLDPVQWLCGPVCHGRYPGSATATVASTRSRQCTSIVHGQLCVQCGPPLPEGHLHHPAEAAAAARLHQSHGLLGLCTAHSSRPCCYGG